MLLRFEVSNHRSIRDRAELSMIAIDQDRDAARQLVGLSEKVLTVAGVYGANGSGKTNLIDALAWLSYAVGMSFRSWEDEIPSDPFGFEPPGASQFGIEMIVEDVRYRYELAVDESRVILEALYSYPRQRCRTLFERDDNELAFRRGTRFVGGGRELITSTTLVLSVSRWLTDEIDRAARWLRNINFVGLWPRAVGRGEAPFYRPDVRRTRRYSERDLIEVFGEPPSRPMRDDSTREAHAERRDLAQAMLMFADLGVSDVEVIEEALDHGRRRPKLRLLHDVAGEQFPLELGDESDGTLAWLSLMPEVLSALRRGGLLVVDELDTSLHPLISSKLVELFQDPLTNRHNAQVIFTTHDTSLLNCLNRDEVWLTSKAADGSTELMPLSDFRSNGARRSANLERRYLQGRFGAVPMVDQFRIREALGVAIPDEHDAASAN